jgi:UDP-N-acetylmuramoyl-L-alanyl-D-glutamate--2,6-diaminopimelate ligase
MNLDRLIGAIAPEEVVHAVPTLEIADLAYDTRSVRDGALFFCVPGSRVDGHELAPAAIAAGAVALVVEHGLELPVPQLRVASVRDAMAKAAVAFFENPSRELPVAGITGTNGKTTTAFLLHSILAAAGRRPGLLTNIERRVGGEPQPLGLNTPEAIDLQRLLRNMIDAGDKSCVMEATSIASAQGRLRGTRFAVLAFTNLTHDHLDFHKNMQLYYQAKFDLFNQTERAVINVGDEWGRRLAAELPQARVFRPSDDLGDIELHLKGSFNRANALAAILSARELGVSEDAIRAGISAVPGVPGRFESIDEGQPFGVIVDYAHTPDSLDSVIRAARELADGRVIIVFGAGGDRDKRKRPNMGHIAAAGAERAIVTTDNPRGEDPEAIARDITQSNPDQLEVILDRAQAIEAAIADAEPGDIVVIAGKGADEEMELADRRIPFDDRTVARDALRRRAIA